jgi:hypothetical protein
MVPETASGKGQSPSSTCVYLLTVPLSLAYLEMRLLAAKFFYHFEVDLCPAVGDWSDQATYFLWEKRPLHVMLKPTRAREI